MKLSRTYLLPLLICTFLLFSCSTDNKPIYQLTANTDPLEAGSVTPQNAQVDEGDQISIQANPNEHWVFQEWTGDHAGTQNPASIIMDGDKSVTARFSKRDYPLTIHVQGEGHVREEIVKAKTTDHPHGTVVKLTPEPLEQWTFIKWSGAHQSEEETITITIDGPVTITAVFEQIEHFYDDGEEEYTATSNGEVIIKTDWDSPDYDEVHFDFEIYYDDGTPIAGARVFYEEIGDIALIRIEGTEEDAGATFIAGTPEEILSLFEQSENLKINKSTEFEPDSEGRVIIAGALIIKGAVVIYKAAKVYNAYQTVRAIWDTALEVREVSTFFSDSIKLDSGGRLYCRTVNEFAGLALDLANIANSTGKILKTFKSPPGAEKIIGDKVYDVTIGSGVSKLEDYVADFIFDTTERLFEDYLYLAEVPIGVIVYLPNQIRLPKADGEQPGFMEIYPNYELCNESLNGRDNTTAVFEVTSATGRIWMDRNLGAARRATSTTDSQAYGDFYQWGRAADGHQKRNSTTTNNLSSSDQPGNSSFIGSRNSPYDWRIPQNDHLWQGVSGINNPCPVGFRLPTESEWNAERQSWSSNDADGAFSSPLKLPLAGYRGYINGSLNEIGSSGYYWASTTTGHNSRGLAFDKSNAAIYSDYRAFGDSIRCIKD